MPAGRPSNYNRKYHIPWVKSLARQGLTVKEIATEIGVAKSTLCKWVSEDEELSDALNEGRGLADAMVEDSLFNRAMGITLSDKKTIVSASDAEQKASKIEITEKQIPPDVTACIFWLKNRKPELWRELNNVALHNTTDMEKVKETVRKMICND